MNDSHDNIEIQKSARRKILLAAVTAAVISAFITTLVFVLFILSGEKAFKLHQLDYIIDRFYYGDVDEEAVNNAVLSGYISALGDNFARYYTSEEAEKREETLEGVAKGIGLIVVKEPDTENIYVKHVYDKCPAADAGIKTGDQITAIDGVSVKETGYTKSVESIIRNIGDTVLLTVLRNGETFDVSVKYSEFISQSVFYKMLDSKIGYIKITSFNAETVPQFKNAVNMLSSEAAEGLLFDLRGNPGGTVESVTEMLDFLLPEGTIMTVKYANGEEKVMAKSDNNEIDLPMAVLTDGASASASELFTASIKDFGKGISVGEKTFGKGVMQQTYSLTDGSCVSITVAEFFPLSGKSFNNVGISPDIEVTLDETQQKYLFKLPLKEDPVIIAAEGYLKNNE